MKSQSPLRPLQLLLAAVALFNSQAALSFTSTSSVYATWNGQWSFSDQSLPGSSVYTRAATFDIHPFDPLTGSYGDVWVVDAIPGTITSVSVKGQAVSLVVAHQTSQGPLLFAYLEGSLLNGQLFGDYDFRGDLLGSTRWRGPISLATAVPEPASAVLLLSGGLLLFGMRRARS